MPSYKTSFCRMWLEDDNYKAWLRAVSSSKAKARCAICTKDFDISNMGEAALRSHMGSAKHKDLAKQASRSVSLAFPRIKAPPEDPQSAGAGKELAQCLNIVPDGTALGLGQASQESAVATPVTSDMKVHVKLAEQVSRAEILWTLKIIMSHYSLRSSDGMGDLLRLMMPDSDIAAKFMCGAKKSTHLSVFGIAPHFLTLLQKRINSSIAFVLLFDESLNKELCQKQLDVHVRYWEGSMTAYLKAAIMGLQHIEKEPAEVLSMKSDFLNQPLLGANTLRAFQQCHADADALCATISKSYSGQKRHFMVHEVMVMLEDEQFMDADIYMAPPDDGQNSDEDSVDEDSGGLFDNLAPGQLGAQAEVVFYRHDGTTERVGNGAHDDVESVSSSVQ